MHIESPSDMRFELNVKSSSPDCEASNGSLVSEMDIKLSLKNVTLPEFSASECSQVETDCDLLCSKGLQVFPSPIASWKKQISDCIMGDSLVSMRTNSQDMLLRSRKISNLKFSSEELANRALPADMCSKKYTRRDDFSGNRTYRYDFVAKVLI